MSRTGVRIAGGSLKGMRLRVPAGVRPTGQRVREAVCSRWQLRLPGAAVLDLFAGSGAIGVEAASRGAADVVLVEAESSVMRQLRAVIEHPGTEAVRLLQARLPKDLGTALVPATFDLIFADPPYAFEAWERLLTVVSRYLALGGEAAVEHSRRVDLPERAAGLQRVESRRYGDSVLSFYESSDGDESTLRK